MEAVTISSKYQVVIPREIRKQYDLKPGQKIMFIPYNGTLRVVVVLPIKKARNDKGHQYRKHPGKGGRGALKNIVDSSGCFTDTASKDSFAQTIYVNNVPIISGTRCKW
jgi:AbrB family looped-hinge helix DNA binding protein